MREFVWLNPDEFEMSQILESLDWIDSIPKMNKTGEFPLDDVNFICKQTADEKFAFSDETDFDDYDIFFANQISIIKQKIWIPLRKMNEWNLFLSESESKRDGKKDVEKMFLPLSMFRSIWFRRWRNERKWKKVNEEWWAAKQQQQKKSILSMIQMWTPLYRH